MIKGLIKLKRSNIGVMDNLETKLHDPCTGTKGDDEQMHLILLFDPLTLVDFTNVANCCFSNKRMFCVHVRDL